MVKYAGMFIKDHPESPVSVYLVRKYFITSTTPDYKQAMTYIDLMMKRQTRNGYLTRMYEWVKYMEKGNHRWSDSFISEYATNGQSVSDNTVSGASLGSDQRLGIMEVRKHGYAETTQSLQHKSSWQTESRQHLWDGDKR